MSEYNNNPRDEYIAPAKEKKSHPVLTVIASGLVAALCGAAGGWFAVTSMGTGAGEAQNTAEETPAVQETAEPGTSSLSVVGESSGMTIAEIAAKASPSVVEVLTTVTESNYGMFGGTYTYSGAGSGVIIRSDGYIITNNHVVEDADSVLVTTYDGKEYEAEIVGTDAKSDIAVLKVEADDLMAAVIGDSSKIQVGETAVVIGNPLGTLGGTVTDGIISATSREIILNNQAMNLIQTNAAINNGNSGGGLFDGNGNLIGIVNMKDSGMTSNGATIEGLGFAIPVNTAMEVAEQLIENGIVTDRATLGVYLSELARDSGKYTAGLYITDIVSGSGAEQAGLKPYDKIIGADDTEISTYADLSTFLSRKKVGDTISLRIIRDEEEMTVNVTLTGTLSTEEKE